MSTINFIGGVISKLIDNSFQKKTKGTYCSKQFRINTERISIFSHSKKLYHYDEVNGIYCTMIGYLSNYKQLRASYKLKTSSDIELISHIYAKQKIEFCKELEGLFSIIIFDAKSSNLYIFQDEFGYHLPLYYTMQNDTFMFSTSMKTIVDKLTKKTLNINAAKSLLSPFFDRVGLHKPNSVVPNNNTLVSEVYKILPGQVIIFNTSTNSYTIEQLPYKINKPFSIPEAKTNLLGSINKQTNQILSLFDNTNDISCTLSSGYDTNLILYYLQEKKEIKNINAITIGGKERNEIPNAEKCIVSYKRTNHIKKIVSKNELDKLPEIIWRNEGYVSERGLFLVFEASKQLNKQGLNSIFLSDCADQILNIGSNDSLNQQWNNTDKTMLDSATKKYFTTFYDENISIEYDVDMDYILKKSGILYNSFSIQPIYPFLNRKTKALSNDLGSINFKKRFYKHEVERTISHNKKFLNKIGGTTDIEYLFDEYPNLIDHLLNKPLIIELLSKKQVNFVKTQSTSYIKIILNLLSIHIFNELFISGNYIKYREAKNFKFSINDFV